MKRISNGLRRMTLLENLRAHCVPRLVSAGMIRRMRPDTSARTAADLGFERLLSQVGCATRTLRSPVILSTRNANHGVLAEGGKSMSEKDWIIN